MERSPRVSRLLAEMTGAEKIGQLQIMFRPRLDDAAQLIPEGIGSVFWPRSAAATNRLPAPPRRGSSGRAQQSVEIAGDVVVDDRPRPRGHR